MTRLLIGAAFLLVLVLGNRASPAEANPRADWRNTLRERLERLDADYPGELGVYVKDLSTGLTLSHRAEESWYIASGIKVPVAIEVFRQIEAGVFTLDSKLLLSQSDYVDGAGQTNWHPPGSRLTVLYLVEQMLIESDNTATDMLIRLVGLDNVNRTARNLVPAGLFEITTLADVRRHAYSGFHPAAFTLKSDDLLAIAQQREEGARIQTLARLLDADSGKFIHGNLEGPYSAYYATHLNSATLVAYGDLLEKLVEGRILSPSSTQTLVEILGRVQTGAQRLKAGLPKSVRLAHKTGTQYARICDMGVASSGQWPSAKEVVIIACSRGLVPGDEANKAIRQVAEAITDAGVFDP